MKNLGFGMMRLPVLNEEQTNFDYEQLNQMVDQFLDAGFTYFDTSYVYHNGKSEEATRKAVVERHPRESFTIATKFPTFILQNEDQIEPIFESQFVNLGVDYIDYYLLHNIQTISYDGIDGKGGIIQTTHLFDHAKKWKESGRIKNFGFSLHSSSKLLDRILTDHPEVDFVQIALNPIDWDAKFVEAKNCYDVIRKHGKKVVIMEALKGGGMAQMPEAAAQILKAADPEKSIASWTLRFDEGLEDVIAVLSGMSTLWQVEDNIKTSLEYGPLSDLEEKILFDAVTAYREAGPVPPSTWEKYEGLTWYGVDVISILDFYNTCNLQPNPGFTDDANYPRNALAEYGHISMDEAKPQTFVLNDGTDVSDFINDKIEWMKAHMF